MKLIPLLLSGLLFTSVASAASLDVTLKEALPTGRVMILVLSLLPKPIMGCYLRQNLLG